MWNSERVDQEGDKIWTVKKIKEKNFKKRKKKEKKKKKITPSHCNCHFSIKQCFSLKYHLHVSNLNKKFLSTHIFVSKGTHREIN